MIIRDQQFERELERMLFRLPKDGDLRPILTSLAKMIGKELDRIEKIATPAVTPSPASGGTVIVNGTTVVTSVGAAPTGVIAIINQAVVAGVNTISFASPLSSATYGGFLVLSDSTGMQIQMSPLELVATSMTKNNFIYNAPQAGQLNGFAMVAN
jgi:hypothetical protein